MPATASIPSLITLLDDPNPAVRGGVEKALLEYRGDVSDDLLALGLVVPKPAAARLSKLLHPGRHLALREAWVVPFQRLSSPDGDWEELEALLRLLSDFLHDGVTVRLSLSDELDMLAEELEGEVTNELELGKALFAEGRLTGNRENGYDPRNSDLAWCLTEGRSNALGLSLIYSLVAERLGYHVYGCNYPGHFLSYIDGENGEPTLVDCFHQARLIPVAGLTKKHPELSPRARRAILQPCELGAMLRRVLANLHLAFNKADAPEDADLIYELLIPFGDDD